MLVQFITGLILFLFAMARLSANVQTLISARIRQYIRYSVRRPLYGLLAGAVSTILLQSSTATTVITVGIVSAGLITFFQSLGIILGADIGTTLTVQLVVWKVTAISPYLMLAGGTLWLLGWERWKPLGEAVFYFGMMFFGLDMTAQASAPLKENALVIKYFKEAGNPLIGFLAGLIFTALVHASAVPISVLVILAQHDLISIENALPIVFGANIGTTATVLLASIAADISGKRTAVAHLTFKIVGVCLCFPGMPLIIGLLKFISTSAAQQIALGHFAFNLIVLLIFIGILGPFSRFLERVMPGKAKVRIPLPEFLDARYLPIREKALDCVRKELKGRWRWPKVWPSAA